LSHKALSIAQIRESHRSRLRPIKAGPIDLYEFLGLDAFMACQVTFVRGRAAGNAD
jgi:hypothetical protein